MAKFKNSDITRVLIMLAAYDPKTGAIVGGILSEKMSLGLRRRLQKIRNAFLEKHNELTEDLKPINEMPEGEERLAELKKLYDEEVEITFDPASLEMIEAIESPVNYDMDLLEKITQ